MAASQEGERPAGLAAAAHDAAKKSAEATEECCWVLEAELETMRKERVAEARDRQAEKEKMKAREDAVAGHDAELAQLART